MSSLQGAPTLGSTGKKQFTYDVGWEGDDDDYIPEVSKTERRSESKADSKKDKKKAEKEKKAREKERHTSSKTKEKPKEKPTSRGDTEVPKKKPVEETYDEDFEDDFEDDFEEESEEQNLDSDDYIPPVTSTPPPQTGQKAPPANPPSAGYNASNTVDNSAERAASLLEEKLRAERAQHERKLREWEDAQAQKEQQAQRRQAELQREIEALKAQQPKLDEMEKQMEERVAAKLAAMESQLQQQQKRTAPAPSPSMRETNQATPMHGAADPNEMVSNDEDDGRGDVGGELNRQQRRRQRERERALQLRRLHEEEAARSLFQRLAQDVREVFHELNLSVVAAEKERLIKDERYRRDREAKDRKEEMERAEKLQKEARERAEREEKFWAAMEEREAKLRAYTEDRLRKDEEERESRLKRDLEDRATRAQNERNMRDELERLENERRVKQETDIRQRDTLLVEAQLNEVKAQYAQQVEEIRRQNNLAREHNEELHKVELQSMEKRHEAALEKLLHQHSHQVNAMESHTANAAKLESLIENMQNEMRATKGMNEKLTEERVRALQEKENHLNEQKAVLDAVMADLQDYKGDLEKERCRVAGLYTKFELSLSTFVKNSEEDRRRLQEAQAHYDTLRQQAEKDRKLMLSEIAQERKVLEQQQEELLARKMEVVNEIQGERAVLSRERTEAAVARERQNRDEGDLLRSLREREQEYTTRIEAMEADRVLVTSMKAEQREILERAAAEREALRREREAFEREKDDLLGRFEEVRRRAEDAASSQDRLRKTLVEERAAREFGITGPSAGSAVAAANHADPLSGALPATVVSRLQMDLARQRAILQKISS